MSKTVEISDTKEPQFRLSLALIFIFLLPLFYVLSTGPVVWLFLKANSMGRPVSEDLIESVYAPLIALSDHFPPIEHFLNAYVGWFNN